MSKIFLTVLLSTPSILSFGQEDPTILQIRTSFKTWQPIIESKLGYSTQLFHYAWGENYNEEAWYNEELNNDDDKFLYQKYSIIQDPTLGTFVYYDNYAISGDWYIAVDYYFDKNEKLYFVYWRLNTFQAEEGLTVEKRLYFNSEGQLIRNLKSVYKMNTKEESEASFADHDVDFKVNLEDMDFYNYWKKTKKSP